MTKQSGPKLGKLIPILAIGLGLATAQADDYYQPNPYTTEIIAHGLDKPAGIATNYSRAIYYSEVPTPGVPGTNGGMNTVKRLDLLSGATTMLSMGEPYPANIALDKYNDVYWTCMTAGVVLKYDQNTGHKYKFLEGLMSPSGIDVHRSGDVVFTELPMPGIKGMNMVSASDGTNISVISDGEPAPTDITVAWDGTAYWTCSTAGVILKKTPAGVISLVKDGLESPTGISLDRARNRLFYTELPTPGVFGFPDNDQGGTNRVVELNLNTMETIVIAKGFPLPKDVAVAPNGKVYWTCTTAGVIACASPTPLHLRSF